MKTKTLLLSLLTALAFTGCSNDDDPGVPGHEQGKPSYLAVNIVTPKVPGVCAAEDGGFADGSQAEDAVESATFVLLDSSDNVCEVKPGVTLEPWKGLGGGYSPNVENVSSAVIVVNGTSAQPDIKGILAILNPPAAISTQITTAKTLADVKAVIDDYKAGFDADDNLQPLVMTNSVYVDDAGKTVIAADVEGKFAKSEDAAKINPVDIYVERVIAKIATTKAAAGFNKGTEVTLNGQEKTQLTIDIKGIQIANCADRSYLFKNVDGLGDKLWTNWTDPTNKRSYWANIPSDDVQYINFSWNTISGVAAGSTALAIDSEHSFYVQENVIPSTSTAKPVQNTAVIVTAQLKDAAGNAFPFVKIGGVYYTPDDGLKQIVDGLAVRHYYMKTGDSPVKYESIPADYFQWAAHAPADAPDVEGWHGFVELKEAHAGDTFYYYDADTKTYKECDEEHNVASVLKNDMNLRAWMWHEGQCYYFVDIEHFGADSEGNQLKGIIRNHVYNLTLNSLKGLGVPVFDPDAVIIPDRPEDETLFYLAARINVLRWKIVNQTVNFE